MNPFKASENALNTGQSVGMEIFEIEEEIYFDDLLTRVSGEFGFDAFEKLHNYYHPILCGYVNSIVHCEECSKDIVADVFFKMWTRKDKLLIKSCLRSYLFRSARNSAYKYLNAENKALLDIDLLEDSFTHEVINPETIIIASDLSKDIEKGIESLTPKCREVFELHRNSGLKYSEIAEKLGISVKAVEANMTRALKFLKITLQIK